MDMLGVSNKTFTFTETTKKESGVFLDANNPKAVNVRRLTHVFISVNNALDYVVQDNGFMNELHQTFLS